MPRGPNSTCDIAITWTAAWLGTPKYPEPEWTPLSDHLIAAFLYWFGSAK